MSCGYVAIMSGGLLIVMGITGTGAYLSMARVSITSMSLARALVLNTLVGRLETQARHDTLTGLLSRADLRTYEDKARRSRRLAWSSSTLTNRARACRRRSATRGATWPRG